jgi:hypothetical protein
MPTAQTSRPTPLAVLVDDVRGFGDGRPALVARSWQAALNVDPPVPTTRAAATSARKRTS